MTTKTAPGRFRTSPAFLFSNSGMFFFTSKNMVPTLTLSTRNRFKIVLNNVKMYERARQAVQYIDFEAIKMAVAAGIEPTTCSLGGYR